MYSNCSCPASIGVRSNYLVFPFFIVIEKHLAKSTREHNVRLFFMVSATKLCPVKFRTWGCTGGKDMSVIRLLRTRNATVITARGPTSTATLIAEIYQFPRTFAVWESQRFQPVACNRLVAPMMNWLIRFLEIHTL